MALTLHTIRCRILMLVLAERGFSRHKLAEIANISPPSLLRLSEFGTPLDQQEADRLLTAGAALLLGKATPVREPPPRTTHPRHPAFGL